MILSIFNTYTINSKNLYLFKLIKTYFNYFSSILLILSVIILCLKSYNYLTAIKNTKTVIYLLHSTLITVLLIILLMIPIGYQLIKDFIEFWDVFWISILIELSEILTALIYLTSMCLSVTVIMALSFNVYKFKQIKPKVRPQQVLRQTIVRRRISAQNQPILIANTKVIQNRRNAPQIVIVRP